MLARWLGFELLANAFTHSAHQADHASASNTRLFAGSVFALAPPPILRGTRRSRFRHSVDVALRRRTGGCSCRGHGTTRDRIRRPPGCLRGSLVDRCGRRCVPARGARSGVGWLLPRWLLPHDQGCPPREQPRSSPAGRRLNSSESSRQRGQCRPRTWRWRSSPRSREQPRATCRGSSRANRWRSPRCPDRNGDTLPLRSTST